MPDPIVVPWTKSAPALDRNDLYAPLLEVKAADDGSGEVEGFAAVFGNVDMGGDIILEGAFKKTLNDWRRAKGRIPLVDGHLSASSQTLLGSVTRAEERTAGETKGLWFRAKFASDPDSQKVRTKALEGHLNGVSIGYLPMPGGVNFKQGEDGEPVRVLSELRLFEISLTPIPMNPDARLSKIKAEQLAGAGDGPPTSLAFETFATELKAALAIGLPVARKAAVDAIVAAYHNDDGNSPAVPADGPDTGTEAASTSGTTPEAASTSQAAEDPGAYALGFVRYEDPSGPSDGTPAAGQPATVPLVDPLQVAQIETDRSAGSLDRFEAEVKQLLGREA
jgi:HK97 family phage prohead protease